VYAFGICKYQDLLLSDLFGLWFGLWGLAPLSTIFQLYCAMRAGFLMEETGIPGDKPPSCRKSLTNFITQYCTKHTSQ
jgi:hypothetical protein